MLLTAQHQPPKMAVAVSWREAERTLDDAIHKLLIQEAKEAKDEDSSFSKKKKKDDKAKIPGGKRYRILPKEGANRLRFITPPMSIVFDANPNDDFCEYDVSISLGIDTKNDEHVEFLKFLEKIDDRIKKLMPPKNKAYYGAARVNDNFDMYPDQFPYRFITKSCFDKASKMLWVNVYRKVQGGLSMHKVTILKKGTLVQAEVELLNMYTNSQSISVKFVPHKILILEDAQVDLNTPWGEVVEPFTGELTSSSSNKKNKDGTSDDDDEEETPQPRKRQKTHPEDENEEEEEEEEEEGEVDEEEEEEEENND